MIRRYLSRTRKQDKTELRINDNNRYDSIYITGSLENIINNELPTSSSFNSKTRKISDLNNNLIRVVNTKNILNTFSNDIFKYSARYIKKNITSFDSGSNTLYVSSSTLDYGTEKITPDNFEIFYQGLHIPGIYTVEQSGSTVVITLTEDYIEYNQLSIANGDVTVLGKFENE